MGEVYLAQHPRLPRRDAVKVLRHDASVDDDFRQRFIREADLAAKLTHPNIVTVHDRGEFNGQLWIVSQYVDGIDAAQLLHDSYPEGMPADLASAIISAIPAHSITPMSRTCCIGMSSQPTFFSVILIATDGAAHTSPTLVLLAR
jgi:serine/threonine protein kinase